MYEHCTCPNKTCPLHPSNHDKGCTPCMSKNLKLKEVPNCFFKLVDPDGGDVQDSSLQAFAKLVLAKHSDDNTPAP